MGDISTQPIRQVAIWILVALTSWKSESSNIGLVVFDKLKYHSQNLLFETLENGKVFNV